MSHTLILLLLIVGILVPGALAESQECRDCSNCCNSNCVSSEMRVEEQTNGIIRVSQLSNGDTIRGIRGTERMAGWCKVEAVYPRAHTDNFTTYDGFTKDHMVIDADTEEFVHEHLNRKYVVMVESAFSNMGGHVDKDETGTITEVVREKGTNNVLLFSAVGCAVAGLLIAVVASVLLYSIRVKRKQKALKEPHPNQQPVMVQDTKA